MSDALKLTGSDLVRALGAVAASPAVDQAARRQAEEVARTVRDAAGDGVVTRVSRRASGDYVVSVAGAGLFAREFGSVDASGDAAITQAIAGLRR